jgi:hypothetical protein
MPELGDVFTILTAGSVTDNGIAMAGGGPSPYYLLSGSGTSLLLAVGVQGDYNLDGTVNAGDYTRWRNTLGDSVPEGTGADGDGDGEITLGDYAIWKAQYGEAFSGFGAGTGAGNSQGTVPEPGSLVMLLMGASLAGCGIMSRQRSSRAN